MKKLIYFIGTAFFALFLFSCSPSESFTEIYLVRHAEKAVWDNPDTTVMYDPELAPEGILRAESLINILGQKGIEVIYSTLYKRNMGTVQPLAKSKGLEINNYHWYEWQDMLDEIDQKHMGKTILICGHGDNILPMISALNGLPSQDSLASEEYDKIFHLIVSRDSTMVNTLIY
jgi:2,3-bisphosphoglycerate-dependent phosphoglycerate mutase